MTDFERTHGHDLVANVNMYVVLKVQNLFEGANLYSSLAQSVEHAAVNRSVVGSSPTGGVLAPWSSG